MGIISQDQDRALLGATKEPGKDSSKGIARIAGNGDISGETAGNLGPTQQKEVRNGTRNRSTAMQSPEPGRTDNQKQKRTQVVLTYPQ